MGSGIDGVDSEHDQSVDFSPIHIRTKFAQRFKMIHGIRFNGLRVIESGPYVREVCIDRMRQRMNLWGLLLSDNDEA